MEDEAAVEDETLACQSPIRLVSHPCQHPFQALHTPRQRGIFQFVPCSLDQRFCQGIRAFTELNFELGYMVGCLDELCPREGPGLLVMLDIAG